jgi:erythromycin esterase-like protein
VVVWAHNAHVGDARATEAAELGRLSLGQLSREAYGNDAVLVGLSTYRGSITAATAWGGAPATMRVGPAREDSHEALLHATGLANLLLVPGQDARADAALRPTRLQRAIGAIYRPERERISHYVFAAAARQFDALVHLDATSALAPLDPDPRPQEAGDRPRTDSRPV